MIVPNQPNDIVRALEMRNKKLEDALQNILWCRPIGNCKNKTIIEIENIAREALK